VRGHRATALPTHATALGAEFRLPVRSPAHDVSDLTGRPAQRSGRALLVVRLSFMTRATATCRAVKPPVGSPPNLAGTRGSFEHMF